MTCPSEPRPFVAGVRPIWNAASVPPADLNDRSDAQITQSRQSGNGQPQPISAGRDTTRKVRSGSTAAVMHRRPSIARPSHRACAVSQPLCVRGSAPSQIMCVGNWPFSSSGGSSSRAATPVHGLPTSDHDPLDLIERDLIARAIVQFGCTRAFVRGHGLGVL